MISHRGIIIGSYRPIDSFLHSLDARAKMLPLMLLLVLALFSASYLFYSTLLLALVGGLLRSGVSPASLALSFRPIAFLILMTSLYHLIFTTGNSPILLSIWGFDLTVMAVDRACFFSLRLLLFVSVTFLITLTNSPSELADGLVRVLKPLKRLRGPVNDLGLILFIVLRFIPILSDEFVAIRNAQLIRGADFSGNWLSRLRRMSSLLLPVFAAAIARADDLALAIEARGYDSRAERTSYGQRSFGAGEYLFMYGLAVMILALFFLTGEVWLSEI